MIHIKVFLNGLKNNVPLDEKILLGLTAAIFCGPVVTIVALVALTLYLIYSQKMASLILDRRSGSIILIAFCVLGMVVPVFCDNIRGFFVGIAVAMIVLAALYIRNTVTKPRFEKMIDLACAASIVCAGLALGQQLLFGADVLYRPDAVFTNANYYATIIEFVVILCAYKLLGQNSRRRKLFYAGTIAANLVGLYLCECRTAWTVIFAAVLMMLFVNKRYKALAIQMVVGGCALGVLYLVPQMLPRLTQVGDDFYVRASIWKTALHGISQHPLLGQGGMTYMQVFPQVGGLATAHAHNLLLDILLNYGLVGLGLLVTYFSRFGKKLITQCFGRDRRFFSLILCFAAAVMIHGVLDVTIFWLQTGLMFAIVCGGIGCFEPGREEARLYHYHPIPAPNYTMRRLQPHYRKK